MSNNYQAVILAGGRGTRLSPMTTHLPKPLLPIAGEPVLYGLFRLLLGHGFTEAKLTLGYLADHITNACGKRFGELSLSYYKEKTPLGTAGSVRAACAGDTRPILVLSGDAVLEADLGALLAFHETRGSAVTLLLAHRDDPSEYGVVLTASDGRVHAFVEKPAAEQAFSDTVNTGIYVLSSEVAARIPADKPFDFARDLFPLLLAEGVPMYGYQSDAYWCDIGDFTSYRAANFRMTDARNLFGKHCKVASPSFLSHTILHDGVTVGARAVMTDVVLCEGVTVAEDVTIGAGSVIGAGAMIASHTTIPPETLIPAGAHIRPQAQKKAFGIGADGLRFADSVTSENLETFARAVASLCDEAGLLCTSESEMLAMRLVTALCLAGVRVYRFGVGGTPLAAAIARTYCLPLTLHLTDTQITWFDADGLAPTRLWTRAFRSALSAPIARESAGKVIPVAGAERLYRGELCRAGAQACSLRLHVKGETMQTATLRAVLAAAGAKLATDAPLVYTLATDGTLTASMGGVHFDHWHLLGVVLARLPVGRTIALPRTAPMVLTEIAERAGVTVLRYSKHPHDAGEATARRAAGLFPIASDGALLAVALTALLAETGCRLDTLVAALPPFAQHTRAFETSLPSAAFLADFGIPDGDGVVRFSEPGTMVRLVARTGGGFLLSAEAETAEAARAAEAAAETELFAALAHNPSSGGQHLR